MKAVDSIYRKEGRTIDKLIDGKLFSDDYKILSFSYTGKRSGKTSYTSLRNNGLYLNDYESDEDGEYSLQHMINNTSQVIHSVIYKDNIFTVGDLTNDGIIDEFRLWMGYIVVGENSNDISNLKRLKKEVDHKPHLSLPTNYRVGTFLKSVKTDKIQSNRYYHIVGGKKACKGGEAFMASLAYGWNYTGLPTVVEDFQNITQVEFYKMVSSIDSPPPRRWRIVTDMSEITNYLNSLRK